jgi:hypothetical protein
MHCGFWKALLLTMFPAMLTSVAASFVMWLPAEEAAAWFVPVCVAGILGAICEHLLDFIMLETRSVALPLSRPHLRSWRWRCWRSRKGTHLDMPYDPFWNGANGFQCHVPAPWATPPAVAGYTLSGFAAQLCSLAETSMILGKLLVFLAFARFAPIFSDSQQAFNLAMVSRSCLYLHVGLCALLSLLCGHTMRELPNVFVEDRRPNRRRNILSMHLMLSGTAVGTFGVGWRSLRYFADGRLDECCITGMQAPVRLLAVLTLDLPHLVLGLLLLFIAEPANSAEDLPRRTLAVTSVVAAMVGMLLAVKTFKVDLRWFVYGGDYRRRREYLEKKAKACSRWKLMNTLVRQQKHEAALARLEVDD